MEFWVPYIVVKNADPSESATHQLACKAWLHSGDEKTVPASSPLWAILFLNVAALNLKTLERAHSLTPYMIPK